MVRFAQCGGERAGTADERKLDKPATRSRQEPGAWSWEHKGSVRAQHRTGVEYQAERRCRDRREGLKDFSGCGDIATKEYRDALPGGRRKDWRGEKVVEERVDGGGEWKRRRKRK